MLGTYFVHKKDDIGRAAGVLMPRFINTDVPAPGA